MNVPPTLAQVLNQQTGFEKALPKRSGGRWTEQTIWAGTVD